MLRKRLRQVLYHSRNIFFYLSNHRKVVSGSKLPFRRSPGQTVQINIAAGAEFIVHGKISFESFQGNRSTIGIELKEGARLEVFGDLIIGAGTYIYVGKDALLEIGGRKLESGAGFTENVKIMVAKKLTIGTDILCSWNVFITDCDWHEMEGVESVKETKIGDHVWITPNCSILKGSFVGENSVIANGSVLCDSHFPNDSLIAGSPAKKIGPARKWARDLLI